MPTVKQCYHFILVFLIWPEAATALVWFSDTEIRVSVEVAHDQFNAPDRTAFSLTSSFSLNRPTTDSMVREVRFALSKDPMRGRSYQQPDPPSEDYKDFLTDVELSAGELIDITTVLKSWSDPISPTLSNTNFTLRGLFSPKAEEDYHGKEEHLKFHLVALVYLQESTLKKPFYYWQSLPVIINITRPGVAVISGLDNVTLLETGVTEMYACINSITRSVNILLDSLNSHGHGYNGNQKPPGYRLSDYGSPPRFIPYFIEIEGPDEKRKVEYEGFESEKFWTVEEPDSDGRCSNENFTFRFNTEPLLAQAAGTGTYSDRITVVVSPE